MYICLLYTSDYEKETLIMYVFFQSLSESVEVNDRHKSVDPVSIEDSVPIVPETNVTISIIILTLMTKILSKKSSAKIFCYNCYQFLFIFGDFVHIYKFVLSIY